MNTEEQMKELKPRISKRTGKPVRAYKKKSMECWECGETHHSCGWGYNEDESVKTFCCKYCDIDGSKYNGWADE